ncbi:Pentatricopeptide repeat [Quillaja saponaria]|uniref:Pentatricopeptide repeat n=1 Tax=Quillaja saponaria TaxID=32244 RepID=A0AAD7LU01_QUISA|nr:Pentatricopeptide repeat [Quillaja saponaria]
MLQRNLSYAKRIISLTNQGQSRQAILCFCQLQKVGFEIAELLLSAVIRACARLTAIHEGKQAHCTVMKRGFNRDTVLMTSLLDMYSKCADIKDARLVFAEMPQRDIVAINSMISGFFRFHLASDAIQLFSGMPERDIGSWNSLISGLAQNSEGNKALSFFEKMRLEGAQVDIMTMVTVLSVCANIAALKYGKQIHGLVINYGFETSLPVGNAVIDMYAKCGCIGDARQCFSNMPFKNVISWTSLIMGYGKNGIGLKALEAFDAMEVEGVIPNEITFLGTLYACSHSGLVQEGWRNFNTMIHKYSIAPKMEHYTCMIDLLARAGRLKDAWDFIERMPIKPDAKLLTAFFSSCFFHMNVELAKIIGQRLLELQPQEAGAYMLLSNFYGRIGDLRSMANVRRCMLNRGIRKCKAFTWIEVDRKIHSFESGDRSHPLSKEIYAYWQELLQKLKICGYVPNTSMVVQNVDEPTKEQIVLGHSEKLAIVLGLISTTPGSRIMIVKNLRVCVDCHLVIALISKIEVREITARDSSRFHHFRDGVCSCGNHW